ncbi:hypothetical protein MCERE19_01716 [Spirosomataceae bacterium]
MTQEVNNNAEISTQINAPNGTFISSNKTRWQSRFEKLKEEVENDIRFDVFIDDFKLYNTLLDGKSMIEKLEDGGFDEYEILQANMRKDKYAKKIVKRQLYETEQKIDVELFAFIKLNFETYIEPLIETASTKSTIKSTLNEKVIMPILNILNTEGKDDIFLNYTADDILGMVYFLTGKCHLNWKKYDNI